MRILNLGCGNVKFDVPEAAQATEIIGVDHSPHSQADIIHDLDVFPYPFDADAFDLIVMQDVLEHLENIPAVMNEAYRIARDGAMVRIRTPHYSSYYAFNDPTHKHAFGCFVLDGFDADAPNRAYSNARFRFVTREIQFPKVWRITGVAALAARYTHRWEQLFAYIFRAENLFFELRAVKH